MCICTRTRMSFEPKCHLHDKHLYFQYKSLLEPIQGMSVGCVEVSLKCNAVAIIVITTSGLSAKTIARYRPTCPVLAIVRHGTSARKISAWRNIIAVQYIGTTSNITRRNLRKTHILSVRGWSANSFNVGPKNITRNVFMANRSYLYLFGVTNTNILLCALSIYVHT